MILADVGIAPITSIVINIILITTIIAIPFVIRSGTANIFCMRLVNFILVAGGE